MNHKSYTTDETCYELHNGFILERADSKEFAISYSIYYPDYFFSQSSEQRALVINKNANCFWVKNNNQRVGGVILKPNLIAKLFLIPPFVDTFTVLKAINSILLTWSDKNKNINAYEVLSKEVECYHRLGFRTGETRKCMIRPTEVFDIEWEDNFEIITPSMAHKVALAELFEKAYMGGIDNVGEQDSNKHSNFLQDYLQEEFEDKTINRASALVFDKSANELVASCLMSFWMGLPILEDIAIHPAYQGMGIGSRLIKRALTILKHKYPSMRLFVTAGNSAEAVYYSLGFLPGEEFMDLYIQAK
jgi:ribosomal protein S18 acetylase RimI-like enzyme